MASMRGDRSAADASGRAALLSRPASATRSLASKFMAELGLRSLEHTTLTRAQVHSCPIDVERQHRHRRAVRLTLLPMTVLGGPLERSGNLARIPRLEDLPLEIERIALFRHARRPAPL